MPSPYTSPLASSQVSAAGASTGLVPVANGSNGYSWGQALPWTLSFNPLLGSVDAGVTVGVWAPNVDTAAIGNGWLYNSSAAQNDEIGWDFTLAAGTYTVAMMFRQNTVQAVCTINLDGSSVGTIDQYTAGTVENQQAAVSGIAVAATGKHRLSFKAATRNASATGWYLVLQLIQIRRTA